MHVVSDFVSKLFHKNSLKVSPVKEITIQYRLYIGSGLPLNPMNPQLVYHPTS